MDATENGKPRTSRLSIALALLSLALCVGLWAAVLAMVSRSSREGRAEILAYQLMIVGPFVFGAGLLLAVGSLIPRRRAPWLGIAALAVWASLPLAAAVNAVGVLETLLWIGAGAVPVALVWLLVWGILWLAERRGPRTRAAITWGLIGLGAAVVLTGAMILTLSLT